MKNGLVVSSIAKDSEVLWLMRAQIMKLVGLAMSEDQKSPKMWKWPEKQRP